MAYYNRRERLEMGLASIGAAYDGLLGVEVVICDDGSSERLFVESDKFEVHILHLPRSKPLNPCVPINRAVRASNSDRIVLTSPEVVHKKPALLALLDMHEPDAYVAAPCYDRARGWIAGKAKHGDVPVPEGAHLPFCAMLSRDLFERAGGYDEEYRNGQGFEDNDFLWRLRRAGATFKLSDVPVEHVHQRQVWNLPSNRGLFEKRWPQEIRCRFESS